VVVINVVIFRDIPPYGPYVIECFGETLSPTSSEPKIGLPTNHGVDLHLITRIFL
jgi:hypothetical protein